MVSAVCGMWVLVGGTTLWLREFGIFLAVLWLPVNVALL